MEFSGTVIFSHLARHKGALQADLVGLCLGYLAALLYDGGIHPILWQSGEDAVRWDPLSTVQLHCITTLDFIYYRPNQLKQ